MDDHYEAGRYQTHLLIVDLLNPQGAFRQLDLETNFSTGFPTEVRS